MLLLYIYIYMLKHSMTFSTLCRSDSAEWRFISQPFPFHFSHFPSPLSHHFHLFIHLVFLLLFCGLSFYMYISIHCIYLCVKFKKKVKIPNGKHTEWKETRQAKQNIPKKAKTKRERKERKQKQNSKNKETNVEKHTENMKKIELTK